MLATVAGAATGQPWLSALGTGLGAINGAMNGDSSGGNSGSGSLQEILENLGKTLGGWFKPTDGNIAKVNSKSVDKTGLEILNSVRNDMQGSTMNTSNPYAGIGEAIFNAANQTGNFGGGIGEAITKGNFATGWDTLADKMRYPNVFF